MSGKNKNGAVTSPLPYCLISVIAVALFALLRQTTDVSLWLLAAICGAGALLLQFGVWAILKFASGSSSALSQEAREALGSQTYGILAEIDTPVLICDRAGRVKWFNRSFSQASGSRITTSAKHFSDFCKIDLSALRETGEPLFTEAFGTPYLVRAYEVKSGTSASPLTVTVWENRSEIEALRRRMRDENLLVAYIAIDNLDELYQYVQEKFGTASAQVTAILGEWAKSVGGVFVEYSKDRFIFLFEASHLDTFIENKFDILDRVRNVNLGDGGLPVTVSIGISATGKTLAEKEKLARSAIDTALQRGGDQVVVRTADGNEYYGGRVQTAQKQTKVRARVFATKLTEMIASSGNVLVMGHVHPDFDAIGACLGIARLSMYCGTKVNIITDFSSEDVKKCRTKLNAVDEYRNRNIFVDASEAQDMITSETLLVIVDVNSPSQFEAPGVASSAPNTVYIDHHRKSGDFDSDKASVYIEPAASSTCELVAELLEYAMNSGSLTREEADIMLAGIMLDSKQFLRNTGSRTFGAALFLRKEGATSANAQEYFKTGLEDLTREAAYETNVAVYRGCIAISQSGSGNNIAVDRVAAAKAADKLLSVAGVAASFVVCTMNDAIHISARSTGKINVQLIIEKLGGGGHFEAAATQLRGMTASEAIKRLKAAIDNYLDENETAL